ncbi:hypothetical protein C1646_706127 [Rhizophagus diaphanus]|nr:hypothetical protein C1646_706127 [Rhizophagus diaphanus] [Rhizophagus sp. MUCL 43196]
MESTLEFVIKHCSTQLELYQRCIENNPKERFNCQKEKNELSKCSEDNNPLLKQIKEQCNELIQAFERCLNENETNPEKYCISLLRDLYDCTENVAAKINKKGK